MVFPQRRPATTTMNRFPHLNTFACGGRSFRLIVVSSIGGIVQSGVYMDYKALLIWNLYRLTLGIQILCELAVVSPSSLRGVVLIHGDSGQALDRITAKGSELLCHTQSCFVRCAPLATACLRLARGSPALPRCRHRCCPPLA